MDDLVVAAYDKGSNSPGYSTVRYLLESKYKGNFYFGVDADDNESSTAIYPGNYDFIIITNDLSAVRFYVDGRQYIGNVGNFENYRLVENGDTKSYIISITLSAGYHLIEAEFVSYTDTNTDTVIELDWSLHENNEFIGFYYSTSKEMETDDSWDEDKYIGNLASIVGKTESGYCTFSLTSLDW